MDMGGPYFGFYESRLTGPEAFWYNAPILEGTTCQKQLPIMGFSYARGVPEMIENFGHRTESVLKHLYLGWEPNESTLWNTFTLKNRDVPFLARCGNIHYAPNSLSDYDWANTTTVASACEDWINFPALTGTTQQFNCERYGCQYSGYGFKKWWFSHLPKAPGRTDGKLNNWWRYIVDYEGSVDLQLPDGHQDISTDCTANGWACDPNKYDQALKIKLYDNNFLVGETIANLTREQAVTDRCGGITSAHGFSYTFPIGNTLRDGKSHTITAKAVDIDKFGQETEYQQSLFSNPQSITCILPTPTPTVTPTPATAILSWTVNAKATCTNGATPTHTTSMSYALWPPNPLTWIQDAFTAGPHTRTITSAITGNSLYVLLTPDSGTPLQPISMFPSGGSNITFGQFFNPLTWMAKISRTLPSGTYTINYQAPDSWCLSPSPTLSPTPIPAVSPTCKSCTGVYCPNTQTCVCGRCVQMEY